MRKNPYNKGLKDQLPLFMQGPSMTTALAANEAQKAFLEESIIPPLHKYEVEGASFTMVQPPFLNPNGTMNSPDLLNLEMGQTEVTQELFEAVMGWNGSWFKDPKNPVEMVTWFDCISFCNKLSELLGLQPCYKMTDIQRMYYEGQNIQYARVTWDEAKNGFRLPKVEEWMIFAKAGTQNQWAGTNVEAELVKYAWYDENSGDGTYAVGDKLPNEWGLYDMSGNVAEWCWDKYDDTRDLSRVLLGGSFQNSLNMCRVAYRYGDYATSRIDVWGFRICRTIK